MYVLTFPLQVIALGLILHRGSYLRSFFNIVDCFVVISSLIPILYYIIRTPPTTDRYCLYYYAIKNSVSATVLLHTVFEIFANFAIHSIVIIKGYGDLYHTVIEILL